MCVIHPQTFYITKLRQMENKRIQQVIYSFFGKHWQKDLQMRFRFWFTQKENQKEKEEALSTLWEQTPSVINEHTWLKLSQLQERIDRPGRSTALLRSSLSGWRKYAAVILLIVLSSASTLFIRSLVAGKQVAHFAEYFVPYGESRQFILPDGSTVWMNAGSVLVYPEVFNGHSRSVYLTGEARFEVTKNPAQPFVVHTQKLDIEALGTVFNVQAYPNKSKIVATLEEGSIRVSSTSGEFDAHILKPDEQLVYSRESHTGTINQVDATDFSAWKDGYLLLEDCDFEEIAAALERKYNVSIEYDQQKYKGRSYYVKFGPNETLEDALKILSRLIPDFTYRRVHNVIFIN